MKVPFTQYLHDEWEEGPPRDIIEAVNKDRVSRGLQPLTRQEEWELGDKAGRPFYEIGLRCEFDTETGRVTVLARDVEPL